MHLLGLMALLTLAACRPTAPASETQAVSAVVPAIVAGDHAQEQISAYVRRIFRDGQGRLWMGTNGEGVFVHDGKQLMQFGKDQGLAGGQVTGILEARDGKIWIATDEGISRFDGSTFRNYREEDGLAVSRAWCILQDRDGVLWAGTSGGLYHLEMDRFVELPLPKMKIESGGSPISSGAIRCLMEDSLGRLWIGTDEMGVLIYDGRAFTHLSTLDGLGDNSITSIVPDHEGHFWLGSMFGGVTRYDGKTFLRMNQASGAIGGDECWTILCDHAGNIWFSCEGYGIYRYDGQSLQNLGEQDGLHVRAVQSILEDRPGRIWVGGGGGLFRYEGKGFINVLKGGPWE